MLRATIEETIDREPDIVFELLSNIERLPEFATGVRSAEWLPPGWIGIGSRFIVIRELLGKTARVECEVTEFRAPKKFSFVTLSTPQEIHSTVTILPAADGGSLVTITAETQEPKGLLKLAAPLIMKQAREQVANELRSARKLLESQT